MTITRSFSSKNNLHEQLYNASSFRSFLRTHFEDKKEQNSNWSLGAWARLMGLSGTSGLSMILNGSRNPGEKVTDELSRYFGFSKDEESYFRNLIKLEKIQKDPELASLLKEKLTKQNPKGKFLRLSVEQFEVISRWHCYLLRELILRPSFIENPRWISNISKFKLTVKEVETAISSLITAGLVTRDENDKLIPCSSHFDTSNDIPCSALKKYQRSVMDLAKKSLEETPVNLREVRSMSLNMSPENMTKAKSLIREFEDQFAALLENTSSSGEVYQLNIQLFPMTNIQKENINE